MQIIQIDFLDKEKIALEDRTFVLLFLISYIIYGNSVLLS